MKKRFPAIITMLLVLVSLLALLSGCGQAWTCDECGKEFLELPTTASPGQRPTARTVPRITGCPSPTRTTKNNEREAAPWQQRHVKPPLKPQTGPAP